MLSQTVLVNGIKINQHKVPYSLQNCEECKGCMVMVRLGDSDCQSSSNRSLHVENLFWPIFFTKSCHLFCWPISLLCVNCRFVTERRYFYTFGFVYFLHFDASSIVSFKTCLFWYTLLCLWKNVKVYISTNTSPKGNFARLTGKLQPRHYVTFINENRPQDENYARASKFIAFLRVHFNHSCQ